VLLSHSPTGFGFGYATLLPTHSTDRVLQHEEVRIGKAARMQLS
jgi:hypothetical protein